MTQIRTLEELLAHAHTLESEAVERYEELAGQMEVHNNRDMAELFRKMANIERKHVDAVETLAADVELPRLAPWDFRWKNIESPEAVPVGESHYLISPNHALSLMLACEERAFAFFDSVARESADVLLQATAAKLAEEEKEHISLLKEWQTRYPEPEEDWWLDLDEPVSQE